MTPLFLHVALIVNPRAGHNRGSAAAAAAAEALRAEGCRVVVFETHHAAHAVELARNAAAAFEYVLGVGGDGTINEVLRGVREHPRMAIGVIPVGTANVLAREIGLDLVDPASAARRLHRGVVREVDVGATDRGVFLVNCGVGFDANVVRRLSLVRRRRRKRMSKAAYVLPGFVELLHWAPPRLIVEVDGRRVATDATDVIVCNARNYGGILSVTPSAKMNDGLFDVCLRRSARRIDVVGDSLAALRKRERPVTTEYLRARRVTVSSDSSAAVQVDGDYCGRTPFEAVALEQKLRLIVPRESES